MKTLFPARPLIAAIALLALLSIAGCQKNITRQDEAAGTRSAVNIYLTDDPSLVFDQLWLDVQKLEIKAEDDSQSKRETEHQDEVDDNDKRGNSSGGWITVNINPGVYDILKFRNGLDTLFARTSFPAIQQLKKLRITLGSKNSITFNGVNVPLTLKGNDNFIVIKTEASSVNINSGGLSNFWIDIDAARSVNRHGNDFELKPSVKLFSKETTGRIEGSVLPKEANALVMAVNGTDTASAKPGQEGEFKFTGLKPGAYSIIYHAVSGNYNDTTIRNIIVKTNEDTRLPNIMLHK